MTLESELKRLTIATQSIIQCFSDGYIDLDDIIEELRPIRMRMYATSCGLEELREE